MHRDEAGDPPALVCQIGSTSLRYHLSAIDEPHAMLEEHGDWMDLGAGGLIELEHNPRNNRARAL